MTRKGFTLIEIIVVVIVLGIIAAAAATNFSLMIEKSRGSEAIQVLLRCYGGYQRVIQEGEVINAGNRLTFQKMGLSANPNADPNRFFDYTVDPNDANPAHITATSLANSSRTIDIDLATGAITKTDPY